MGTKQDVSKPFWHHLWTKATAIFDRIHGYLRLAADCLERLLCLQAGCVATLPLDECIMPQ
eukprot:2542357-Amphidinium_carterae.1